MPFKETCRLGAGSELCIFGWKMRFVMVLGSDSCGIFKENSVLVQRPHWPFSPCCSEMKKLDTTLNLGGAVLLAVNSLWRLN